MFLSVQFSLVTMTFCRSNSVTSASMMTALSGENIACLCTCAWEADFHLQIRVFEIDKNGRDS